MKKTEKPALKKTEKLALLALAVGAAAAGGLYYLDPDLHWGWYVGVPLLIAATMYSQCVKDAAAERIANGD
ncbi:hypothetical protein [Bordetella hinzii]|uniref:hypothetical protein n=1 Tax=Bordetella hinzii TaxID=103855 RepID=UPI000764933D|nr:hypothetical protein [Bordetella hinzii]KXA72487.1 hypothetical protein AXA74_12710 [Bordetella hinzii LMG 13501]VEH25206.1 Uncharacterised protein [Bordetella hinzii]